VHSFGDVSLLAETGALENLALELQRRVVEVAGELGVLHEPVELYLEMRGRKIAGVVDEVDGSRAGHDVDGRSGNENGGEDDDADEIVLEVEPELVNVVRVELGGLDDNDSYERDQTKSQEVGNQVVVAQFHVLEIHALEEVR
jgi:hypothetical protein